MDKWTAVGMIFITLIGCTLLSFVGWVHLSNQRTMAEHGYTQVQNIGESGYHWEKR